MPSDLVLKAMNAIHRTVLTVSGGRVGWAAWDMPVLKLTTQGRRSGRPRSVMLTSPLQEGTTLVVVASRGGDDRPPAWLLNLQETPEVSVTLQGEPTARMRARVATAAERHRLWPLVVADHRNYAAYQSRTTREIALVLLEPEA
ncbi:MAG: nitroreductase family deazaflavin-dependent oxidoreductase [Spirochaetaceae bacterium]|nr:nitroreductase family deazaflavin-dependent oxidoreductase [Spirochaetaceae bacterium]